VVLDYHRSNSVIGELRFLLEVLMTLLTVNIRIELLAMRGNYTSSIWYDGTR